MRDARVLMIVVAVAVIATGAGRAAGQVIESQPFLGVKLYSITQSAPRPNNIQLLEIDLAQANLRFRNSLRDPGLPNGDETITQTTRQFVDEQSAQIGINTTFFRLDNSGLSLPTNNVGLLVSDGDLISPWDSTGEAGINLSSSNVASLITAPSNRPTGFETNPTTVSLFNAVRGSNRLLSAGTNVAPADSTTPGAFLNLNPRTAMGYTAATNKLLLATIDGRQSGFSEGMYLREVAELLKSYGASEAINLDGGGSTTMAFDYYGDGPTRSQLVNRPVGRGTPGSERYVGASLAVFAPRNPAYVPPAGLVTVAPPPAPIQLLDDFEDGVGHFFNDPDFSGSNRGLREVTDGVGPSTSERDANHGGRAYASQRIDIASADDPAWTGFQLRHLSGQGNPANNAHLGTTGHVGFLMRTLSSDLAVSVMLDENLGTAIEQGIPIDLIADGGWHLYQWDLSDPSQWQPFTSSADGDIDGPIMTIDSILITSPVDRDAAVWLDAVAYNPSGNLNAIPEPLGLASLATFALPLLLMRRRRPR